jgi:DNA gyrase subunit B
LKKYDENSIEILEFPDDVRKRPGMYIGGTTVEGMHHLYKEIIDNSCDEAVAKHCNNIVVTNEGDGFLFVLDNGRGIPTGINKQKGVSALELVFTVLHAGGKFNNDINEGGYKSSAGLNGVGASVTNAVSEYLEVFVKKDNKIWTQNYTRGIKNCEVKETKDCNVDWIGKTGTFVRFKPDKQVFKHIDIVWDYDRIVRRCREIAFLVPGLKIDIKGWNDEDKPDISFKFDNGLHDYLDYHLKDKKRLIEDTIELNINLPELGCSAQAVFTYEAEFEEHLATFANNVSTYEGGVHYNAFLNALLKVITDIGEREKITKNFSGKVNKSDILEGLHGIILVRLLQPEFEGQTKTKLGNPEIRVPLEAGFLEQLQKIFDHKLKKEGVLIAEKILQAVIARENARKAKELTKKKKGLEHFTLKGKLADCESKNPEECELYLVEGDCFHKDTKIITDQGYKSISEIKDGDMIYTANHRYRKAKVRKPKIKKQKCKITIQGKTFICSQDHLWLVMRCNSDVSEWVPAKDLRTDDLIVKTVF